MRKIITAVALVAVVSAQPASAQPSTAVRVEIWPTENLEQPFTGDAPIEMSVRVSRRGYITLYQINPQGGVEIIYPKSHHCWRALEPNRTYRLTELAEDIRLEYGGAQGSAYVGGVLTEQAMHIVPWLKQSFSAHGLPSGKNTAGPGTSEVPGIIAEVERDIQFRLGVNSKPGFAVAPLRIQSPSRLAREQPPDDSAEAPAKPKRGLKPSPSSPAPFTLQRDPSAAANALTQQPKSKESVRGNKKRDSLTTPFKGLRKPPASSPVKPKPAPKQRRSTEKQSPQKTGDRKSVV